MLACPHTIDRSDLLRDQTFPRNRIEPQQQGESNFLLSSPTDYHDNGVLTVWMIFFRGRRAARSPGRAVNRGHEREEKRFGKKVEWRVGFYPIRPGEPPNQ